MGVQHFPWGSYFSRGRGSIAYSYRTCECDLPGSGGPAPLYPCMEGSGETARLHRLARAFAARISKMYQTQFTLKSVRLVCILYKI